MNWTSEFAKHSKAKRNKKRQAKNRENLEDHTAFENIEKDQGKNPKFSKLSCTELASIEKRETEVQTEGKQNLYFRHNELTPK